MLKINITEGKHNRFEQAANILGVVGTLRVLLALAVLATLNGEVEVDKSLYAQLEADIAAVGDCVAKDWLRAYGVGEEAAKLRATDLKTPQVGDEFCDANGLRVRVTQIGAFIQWENLAGTGGGLYGLKLFNAIFAPVAEKIAYTDEPLLNKHAGDFWHWNIQMAAEGSRLDKIKADAQKKVAMFDKHPLQEVFDAVIAQVTTGKGQRHGGGEQPFYEQPWFTTTQQVGIGFPLGQAMKKLGESSSKPDAESFETELLGAIAYAAMAYLANKKLAGKS